MKNGLVIESACLGFYSAERYESIQTTIGQLVDEKEPVFLLFNDQKYELPITLYNDGGVEVNV